MPPIHNLNTHPHYRVVVEMVVSIPEHSVNTDHTKWINDAIGNLYPYQGGEPWLPDVTIHHIKKMTPEQVTAMYAIFDTEGASPLQPAPVDGKDDQS